MVGQDLNVVTLGIDTGEKPRLVMSKLEGAVGGNDCVLCMDGKAYLMDEFRSKVLVFDVDEKVTVVEARAP